MIWINPFTNLSKREQKLHAIVWLSGIIMINIPDWNVTMGLFHSNDYSLIIPSLYGLLLNGYLFYGCAFQIENSELSNIWGGVKRSLRICLVVTVIESLLDISYFFIHYGLMNLTIIYEIILGQFLMNSIFFYLPSLLFGFFKAWKKSESKTHENKLIIKDGHQKVHLHLNELSHLESDGNYTIYYANRKHVIRQTLAQAERELPDFFARCHKSFIVNTYLIEKQSYDQVVVKGNTIPIGRKYRKNISVISNN